MRKKLKFEKIGLYVDDNVTVKGFRNVPGKGSVVIKYLFGYFPFEQGVSDFITILFTYLI